MQFFRDHPQLLLIGGLVLIVMYFMSRIAKRRRTGGTSILSPHEQLERIRQARGMRGDLEQLMVEIEQMAKRMSAHLDAKSVYLQRLLDQADERIETLRALEKNKASAASPTREPAMAGSKSYDASGAAASSSSENDSVQSSDASADDADEPDDPLARQVYALADQGKDSHAIARQLEEHVGKIELILALRSA